jgi:ribose/xylose/arabinose/galactoside ABC-type transport system permease subunit
MRIKRSEAVQLRLLQNAPLVLFVAVFVLFGLLSSNFFRFATFEIIVQQAAITGILAVGITFVLLTAGIDLSVGSAMYLAAVVMAELLGAGSGILPALAICVLVGAAIGVVNAVLVTRLRIVAFIATLAMLFIARGVGVSITESRAVDFPEAVADLGSARLGTPLWDVPVTVLIFLVVVLVAHVVLTRTTFGRQLYAVGNDPEGAVQAGLRRDRIVAGAYVICSLCAGLAALVAAGQLGNASPGFGEQKEFDAIAAAVLGGTSLFGGRGNVLPGTVVGALLIQTVAVGLVFTGVDIYYLDMVTALTIFVAVLLDAIRTRKLERLERRAIRSDTTDASRPSGEPALAAPAVR